MYKIIQDDKVLDVVKNPIFIRVLESGHIAITDKTSATGIVGSDGETIYHFTPKNDQSVSICNISAEEFKRLKDLLNAGQIISADETALEKAKRAKISSLSNTCKNKINSGFSVDLSEGNCKFKLTVEDQLNLMSIESQITNGENTFIYHATDKPCQVYLREDMIKIIRAYKAYILYHTTYFNAAKQYIRSLTDLEKVNLFTYGEDVSSIIEDPILKQILKSKGGYCG